MFRASAIVQNTHSLQQHPQSQHGFIGMTTATSTNGAGPNAGTPTLLQVSSSTSPINSSGQKTNKRHISDGGGGGGKHIHHTLASSGMIIGSVDGGGGSSYSSHIGIGRDGIGNSHADARGSFISPLSSTTTTVNTSSSQGRSTFKNVNSLAISSSDNNFNNNRHHNSDIINSLNNHKRIRMDSRQSNKQRQSSNNSQNSIHNFPQQNNLNDLADAAIMARMNSQDRIGNNMGINSSYPVSQSMPINLSTATSTNPSLIHHDRTSTQTNAQNHYPEQMLQQYYLNSLINQPSTSSPYTPPYVSTSSSNISTSNSGQFLHRNTVPGGGGGINIGIGGGSHMSNTSPKVVGLNVLYVAEYEVKFPPGMIPGTHKLIMLPNNMGHPGTGTFVINQDLLNSINLQRGSIIHAAPGAQQVFQHQGIAPGTIPYAAIRTTGVQPHVGIATTPLQQMVRGQVLATLPSNISSVLTSGAQQQQQQQQSIEDDVSDEDPVELFETDNVVVCQYDKVTRTRNKWKFYFKDGIMNLKGKDYVFSRALGDAEW
ncbi:transcription initiation factor IIA subunit 1-like protein [Euroglyphus maynei]|uniref:Transcription initiation factor IIA subunit 1-like protein n=1 Tax=Euroglyphus maynei TaxID=6958 RepID=A0A1Y3AZ41_EURMA|nr:transcription initiation factor IIA subunit 1-like protein [Euroglyphus maynei]